MRRDVFQAIADPTRREILLLVSNQSMNLNAIAENFEVSRPAISQHIKILIECGLINVRQRGRERICELQAENLNEVRDWLEPFRKLWEHRVQNLDTLLQKMNADKTK